MSRGKICVINFLIAIEKIPEVLVKRGDPDEISPLPYYPPTRPINFRTFVEEMEEILKIKESDKPLATRALQICINVASMVINGDQLLNLLTDLESRFTLDLPGVDKRPLADRIQEVLDKHQQQEADLKDYQTYMPEFSQVTMRTVGDFLGINIDHLDPTTMNRLEGAILDNEPNLP